MIYTQRISFHLKIFDMPIIIRHVQRGCHFIDKTIESMCYKKHFPYCHLIFSEYYHFGFFVTDQVSKNAALTTKAPPKIVVNEARSANTTKAKRLP